METESLCQPLIPLFFTHPCAEYTSTSAGILACSRIHAYIRLVGRPDTLMCTKRERGSFSPSIGWLYCLGSLCPRCCSDTRVALNRSFRRAEYFARDWAGRLVPFFVPRTGKYFPLCMRAFEAYLLARQISCFDERSGKTLLPGMRAGYRELAGLHWLLLSRARSPRTGCGDFLVILQIPRIFNAFPDNAFEFY